MVNPVNKLAISDSQFAMWRAVIAIAHADGKVQPEERAYLDKTLKKLDAVYNLSDAQRKLLADDMVTPQKVSALLPAITEPQYRSMLIHFGEILAWADNEISVDEEAILKKLHDGQLGGLDLERLRAEVQKDATAQNKEHADEMKKIRTDKRTPIFNGLDRLLRMLKIDILD